MPFTIAEFGNVQPFQSLQVTSAKLGVNQNDAMIQPNYTNRAPLRQRLNAIFERHPLTLRHVRTPTFLAAARIMEPQTELEQSELAHAVDIVRSTNPTAEEAYPNTKCYQGQLFGTYKECCATVSSLVEMSGKAKYMENEELRRASATIEGIRTREAQNAATIRADDREAKDKEWCVDLAGGKKGAFDAGKTPAADVPLLIFLGLNIRQGLGILVGDFFQRGIIYCVDLRPVQLPVKVLAVIKAWMTRIEQSRGISYAAAHLKTLLNPKVTHLEWMTMSRNLPIYLKFQILAIYYAFRQSADDIATRYANKEVISNAWWGGIFSQIDTLWERLMKLGPLVRSDTAINVDAEAISDYVFLRDLKVDGNEANEIHDAAMSSDDSAPSMADCLKTIKQGQAKKKPMRRRGGGNGGGGGGAAKSGGANKKKKGKKAGAGPKCHKCDEYGHIARVCTNTSQAAATKVEEKK